MDAKGEYIYHTAFLRKGSVSLKNWETGETENLIPEGKNGAYEPVVTKDGSKLYYFSNQGTSTSLHEYHIATKEDRIIKTGLMGIDATISLSGDFLPRYDLMPDEKSIILNHEGNFAKLNIADGSIQKIPMSVDVKMTIGDKEYAQKHAGH